MSSNGPPSVSDGVSAAASGLLADFTNRATDLPSTC
jgi:hypothetical protein